MKRMLPILVVLLLLPACARRERPEGAVERWLRALNQGSAGEPGRYAPATISNAVLPGWEDLDPGEFDVIEVGSTDAIGATCVEGRIVPFRVIPLEGDEVRGAACVVRSRIVRLIPIRGVSGPVFPSDGGPAVTDDRVAPWLIASGMGLAILLGAELLIRLVRREASS